MALALLLLPCLAGAAPRIGLVTMEPGEQYWSRFGHNAILVADPDSGERTFYNYGFFDFEQPGFLLRFLRGQMLYRLVALPMDVDLHSYAEEGRGATLQWLALQPEQARRLEAFLRDNARPENAEYPYEYFVANCSTKVRDALDMALDGAIERQLRGRSRGLTWREESLRLSAPEPWLYLGIHAGLAGRTDRPLSRWEEGFVPMHLRDALRELRDDEGRPLVLAEVPLLPHRLEPAPETAPRWRWAFAAAGIALGLLVLAPLRFDIARRPVGLLTLGLWSLAGIGGTLFVFLWLATEHTAAHGNENLLLFNPLALLLLPAAWRLFRGRPASAFTGWVALAIALAAGAALFLKFLPWRLQSNGDWIAFWLPLHAAGALLLQRMVQRSAIPAPYAS